MTERAVAIAALVAAALFVVAMIWTWTLRRTVQARTIALSHAFIEQKRLTDILRQNEDRLAFAMDVIGAGAWEWDLRSGRLEASTRWAGSFGYDPEEAPASYEAWMAYVHPDDRARVERAARAHLDGRAPRFEATYRIPRKNGDWVWVADRGRIVRWDDEGKPARMVGAIKDITVRLAAERALQDAKETAEANSRAKSAFLATVSHEIRTPLNAVIGTSSLLETTALDENQRELVSLIKRGGDSLLALVNDVLDFTKIEAGRIEIESQPFEVAALVNHAIFLFEHSAAAKGLTLHSTIDPVVPRWLRGDVTRLRQILLNLLSNAIKFTAEGVVHVDVSVADAAAEPPTLRVAVCDTGIGIPANRLDRLFEPFLQVDSSTTRRFGGTGLGLTISQRLAELMGGTLSADSVETVGSTFTLTVALPRAEAAPALITEPVHAPTQPSALRVVLAEDNVVNQLVQRRMLRQLGYACDVTANGVELLQAMGAREYDVAILDIQMPEMDGIEAARLIRARDSEVYLVALTADVTAETRESCFAAGFNRYLSKPVTAEMLAAALADRPRSARRNTKLRLSNLS